MKHIPAILLLIVAICLSTISLNAQTCFGDFMYRVPVTVTNPTTNTYTNEPVCITVATDQLIDDGKMQLSGNDIRVTNVDGVALPMWIDVATINTSATKIWIKLPELTPSGLTVYLFYGNPSAPAPVFDTEIFSFFDDFTGTTLDTDKWRSCGTHPWVEVTGGQLHLKSSNNIGSNVLVSQESTTRDFYVEARMAIISGDRGFKVNLGQFEASGAGAGNGYAASYEKTLGTQFFTVESVNGGISCPSTVGECASAEMPQVTGYWGFSWASDNRVDAPTEDSYTHIDSDISTPHSANPASELYTFISTEGNSPVGTGNVYIDWIRYRPYRESEITTSLGTETIIGSSIKLNLASNGPLCQGTALELTSTLVSGAVYSWYRDDVLLAGTSNTNIISNPVSGTYSVVANLGSGECNNKREEVYVLVSAPTDTGHLPETISECYLENEDTLRLTGYHGDILKWQYRVNEGYPWYDLNRSTDYIDYAGLTQTHTYRALVKSGACAAAYSNESTVRISPTTDAGLLDGDTAVCISGHNVRLSLSDHTGDIEYWEYSTNLTNWQKETSTATERNLSGLPNSRYYRVKVKSGTCDTATSNHVRVSVNPVTEGGEITNGKYVCAGINEDTLKLENHTGNIVKWQSGTTAGGPWSDIPVTDDYFIYKNLGNTTYYRAIVESAGCGTDYAEIEVVNVEQLPVAGTLNGSTDLCATSNSGSLQLTGYSGKVTHVQTSLDGNSWSMAPHTGYTYSYNNVQDPTYYRLLVNTPNEVCTPDTSSSVFLNVSQPTIHGELRSPVSSVCEGENNVDIVLNNYRGDIVRWETSTTGEAPWTALESNEDSIRFDDLDQATWFRTVVKNGACAQQLSNVVPIHVDQYAEGGTLAGSTEQCAVTNNGFLTLSGQAGEVMRWEKSPDRLTWSTVPGSYESEYNFSGLTDTTFYRVIMMSGECYPDTSTIAKVTINPLPLTRFEAENVNLGNPVNFANQSTIEGGYILGYTWDFGNEETSSARNPKYNYLEAGTYRVRLTAQSNKNCIDSISHEVTVYDLPDVDFSFENVCLHTKMNFTNLSSTENVSACIWRFGDGSGTVSGTDAAYTYKDPGSYDVTLKIISTFGGEDSITKTVIVYPRSEPDFTYENLCRGEVAKFANRTVANAPYATYQWDFGNGTTDTRTDPESLYDEDGQYLVTLLSTTDKGCKDSISKIITVFPRPVAEFTAQDAPYRQPNIFINESSITYGELNYNWDFGDRDTSSMEHPQHIYESPGVYSVELTAVSDSGCTDTQVHSVKVHPLPVARFTFNNVCFGDSMHFVNESTIPSGTLDYEWDFGDGNESEEVSPSHSYSAPGLYEVELICISSENGRDTIVHEVEVFDIPYVDFSFNEACDGFATYFNNETELAGAEIQEYLWDFGDGANAVQENPEKTFLNPGVYRVSLEAVTLNGCEGSTSKQVIVHHNPIADFESEDVCHGKFMRFTNHSSILTDISPYSLNYSWTFGDNSSSILEDPDHRYEEPGEYEVKLVVSSNVLCRDSLVRYYKTHALPEANAGEDTNAVLGFPIRLLATGGEMYEWTPEEGLSDPTVPDPDATPLETTNYSVRVTDENNCINYDSVTVSITDANKIIPSNVLTPNDNGENDTWQITNIESYPQAELFIFDRWGNVVYETTEYQNDWQGTNNNGDILPDGSYFYVIQLNNNSGKVYKGAITILRDK